MALSAGLAELPVTPAGLLCPAERGLSPGSASAAGATGLPCELLGDLLGPADNKLSPAASDTSAPAKLLKSAPDAVPFWRTMCGRMISGIGDDASVRPWVAVPVSAAFASASSGRP